MRDDAPIGFDPQDEHAFRVAYLVAGFIRGVLTEAEDTELDNWVTASMDNQRLFERLIDEKNIQEGIKQLEGVDTTAALEKIKERLSFLPEKKRRVTRAVWMYAAAACLLAVLVAAFFFVNKGKSVNAPPMVLAKPADIDPGKDRALLTLSNGETIGLDTIGKNTAVVQGNTSFTKLDSGQLAYQQKPQDILEQARAYNTLTVPAGGQYKVILADGTRVWLNAASSLRYPTAFNDRTRTVELTGEAYFEVAKDPMHPFVVKADGATVQVLGTHFDVNAYADEPALKVVLAEGSIKLNNTVVLKPGEEGIVAANGNIQTARANIETALAWKNGQFIFRQTPLDVLMRQVGRWYNADIIYTTNIRQHFNAEIARNVPVSKLLHLLEATEQVHFSIENNKITVMK